MNIGFIGLGTMGGPMAANLVRAGHSVVGYNRSEARRQRLVDAGGRAATSVGEAVANADVVLTMLPDSPDVEAVAFGPDGVLENACSGAVFADMSTIRPDVARELSAVGAERGVRVLDAPVSGGESGAIEGTLSIMVGGEAKDLEAVADIFYVLGSTVVHVGSAGSGQTVKAANQLIVAGTIGLVAEALIFLEAHGVDTDAAVQVLAGGLAGNRILDRKAATMLAREFTPGFRIDLQHKDLGIFLDAARERGVAAPLGAVAAQLVAALNAQGHSGLDHSALMLIAEQLSGKRG